MLRRNQPFITFLNLLSDAAIILLSYFLSIVFRYNILGGYKTLPLTSGLLMTVLLFYSVLLPVLYYMVGAYKNIQMRRTAMDMVKLFFINGVGVLTLVAVFYLIRIIDFSRWALAVFWLISSLLILLKRIVIRSVLYRLRKNNKNIKHVILIGSGTAALHFAEDVCAQPQLGIRIDGYFGQKQQNALNRYLGNYADIPSVIPQLSFDSMVVALEPCEVNFMSSVLDAADKEGIHVEMVPFFNEYIPVHPEIDSIGQTKVINLRATPLDSAGWSFVKRMMDVICSLLLIILTSPVMILTAIGVKLSSPGPVFFKQERIGLNKKPFKMLKFRSMRTDIDHSGWSTKEDNRKTPFGSFIRKFSIDELPQFFNVLAGQMSLIGPRPEIPRFVDQFKEEIPLYLVRQQVRPGITGWAQVNGLRGDTSIEERVKYDIWYIENWSIELDIRILFRTVFGGFMNEEKLTAKKESSTEAKEAEKVAAYKE